MEITPSDDISVKEANALKESFNRFKAAAAQGRGLGPVRETPAPTTEVASAGTESHATADAAHTPATGSSNVTWGADGSARVVLDQATTVSFSAAAVEVTMSSMAGTPATTIKFDVKAKSIFAQAYGFQGVSINGRPYNEQINHNSLQRHGALSTYLDLANRAASIAEASPNRPENGVNPSAEIAVLNKRFAK